MRFLVRRLWGLGIPGENDSLEIFSGKCETKKVVTFCFETTSSLITCLNFAIFDSEYSFPRECIKAGMKTRKKMSFLLSDTVLSRT